MGTLCYARTTYEASKHATSVYLRHRMNNSNIYESSITYYDVNNKDNLKPDLELTSQKKGSTTKSNRDYWYVEYTSDNTRHSLSSGTFYCSFTSKDSDIATLKIENYKFYVSFSKSSGCKKTIY